MSVKLIFHSGPPSQFQDDTGFCYCRRNAAALRKRKQERSTTIELIENKPLEATIDFGSVPVESSQFHEIVVASPTGNIPGNISEDPENGLQPIDPAFRFAQSVAQSLPACAHNDNRSSNDRKNSKLSFRIYFDPQLPGMHYAHSIDLRIGGVDGIPVRVNCRGDTYGPALCFSENQINFGGQYFRDETKRGVKLINLSDCEAKFQFDIDNTRSTFKVCPTAGIVPPQTTLKLELTFRAPKPQAYYKRIMCLVLHQQPQFLDLFGVCIPRPFMPPVSGIDFAVSSFQTQFLPLPSQSNDEYFDTAHRWGINLSSDQIDFGYHEPDRNPLGEYEPLSFSSNLPYDVVVDWTSDASEVFLVSPQSAILPAYRSTLFQVSFRPNFPNVFYSGLLECFIHPTGYNWPPEFGPPWAIDPRDPRLFLDLINVTNPATASQLVESEEEESEGEHVQIDVTSLHSSLSGTNENKKARKSSKRKQSTASRASRSSPRASRVGNKTPKKSIVQDAVQLIVEATPVEAEAERSEPMPAEVEIPEAEIENTEKSAEEEPKNIQNPYFRFLVNLSHIHDEVPKTFHLEPVQPQMEPVPKMTQMTENGDENTLEGTMLEADGDPKLLESLNKKCEMPQQLGLPLCLTLRVLGHTFRKSPPVTTFKLPRRIIMEVTWPLHRVSRTICLKNCSDFPVHFDATSIEEHGVYKMKPNKGVIPGNFHQLAMVYMTPNSPQPLVYIQNSNIILNLTDKNKVSLCGSAEIPKIDMIRCYVDSSGESDSSDGLLFPMTVPNFESTLIVQFINPTRFYCKYSLELDMDENVSEEPEIGIFEPTPAQGIVLPYEMIEIKWTFRPRDLLRYTQIWKCIFNVQCGRVEPKEQLPHFIFKFPISGIGESCQVEAYPTLLDYGLVELYTHETMTFTITNKGNAVTSVYFKAIHEEWLQNFPPEELSIDPGMVTLKGQESVDIQVTVRPHLMTMERFYIKYSMCQNFNDLDENHPIVAIRFLGDHPTLKIVDINHTSLYPICDGTFSWSMFSLDKLNKFLGHGTHSLAFEGRVKTPPTVVLNFPPAPIGSESAIFTILLSNKGRLGTCWEIYKEPPKILPQFLIDDGSPFPFNGNNPTDPNFLSSLWSRRIIEKYQKSVTKLNLDLAREKNICFSVKPFKDVCHFKVLPHSGRLEVSDKVQISFRYVYKEIGFHDMYFLLRVHPSNFIWLHVKGRTLQIDRPFIQHFYDHEVKLVPVSLTDMDPPIQHIWLYNGGTVPAKFQINDTPFVSLKRKNFGHGVFDLVSKRGFIPPRSWGSIKIRFSPIEMLDYVIDFMVKWEGKEILVKVNGSPLIHRTTLLSPSELGILFAERYSQLVDPISPVSITPTHVTIRHFVPTAQEDTSVIFLTNLSNDHQVSFSWPEVTEIDGNGSITFRPSQGILLPNGKIACQIIIRGGNASVMCTSLIRCTVTDLTEESMCKKQLKKWDDCKTFLLCNKISEPEANARLMKKYGQRPENYEPCSKVISLTVYVSSPFGMLDYSKTSDHMLRPPIPPCKPLPMKTLADIQNQPELTLPPFSQLLSREILRCVLWDIVHSDSFEKFEKLEGAWKAPIFKEYEASEIVPQLTKLKKKSRSNLYDTPDISSGEKRKGRQADAASTGGRFPLFGSHEVLKEVLFNLVIELDKKFEPGTTHPIDLSPVSHQKLFQLDEMSSILYK